MRYHGHAPGHVRETFCNAVDAFVAWRPGEPEPMVDFEIGYVPHPIPISKACTLVWNCTDIIPGCAFDRLRDEQLEMKRCTYAACARAMHTAPLTAARSSAAPRAPGPASAIRRILVSRPNNTTRRSSSALFGVMVAVAEMMSVAWMLLMTPVVFAEKVLPHGPRISVVVALGLIALGLLVGTGAVQLGAK